MWRISSVAQLTGLSTPYFDRHPGATTRGVLVHNLAEAALYGEILPEVTGVDGYVQALHDWLAIERPDVLFVELRVTNFQRRLTGRIDLGAIVQGKPFVIDFKSGSEEPAHGPLMAGYKDLADNDPSLRMLLDTLKEQSWSRANLYLQADGKFKWRPRTDPDDAVIFRSALKVLTFRLKHGLVTVTDDPASLDDAAERGVVHG